MRVRATKENRAAILKEAEIFGARAVDSSVEGFALEATGDYQGAKRMMDKLGVIRPEEQKTIDSLHQTVDSVIPKTV